MFLPFIFGLPSEDGFSREHSEYQQKKPNSQIGRLKQWRTPLWKDTKISGFPFSKEVKSNLSYTSQIMIHLNRNIILLSVLQGRRRNDPKHPRHVFSDLLDQWRPIFTEWHSEDRKSHSRSCQVNTVLDQWHSLDGWSINQYDSGLVEHLLNGPKRINIFCWRFGQ